MPSRAIRSFACALVVLGAVLGARPALAQPTLLKESTQNILMGPLDAFVAPYTAWETLQLNMEPDMSTGGKITTDVIGFPYNWGTYVVLGGFRLAAGVFGIPIGLALWPVNAFHPVHVGPLFDTSESAALVDAKTSVMDFKFGGRWLTAR
jgi:hypothetical protein